MRWTNLPIHIYKIYETYDSFLKNGTYEMTNVYQHTLLLHYWIILEILKLLRLVSKYAIVYTV